MTIQEFIERTGFAPTDDYYHSVIEPEYMASSENDKDKWCKQWKKNGGIQKAYDALREQAANDYAKVLSLENEVKDLKEQLSRLKVMNDSQSQIIRDEREKLFNANQANEKLNNERKDLIDDRTKLMYSLIGISERYSSSELRELIINEIGFKAYIAYKLENDMNIWQLDKDAIIDNLK